MRTTASVAVLAAVLAGTPALAGAQGTSFPGTRPLGTGGAMRGMATGETGPLLNPSGMSLTRAYTVDGAYLYGRERNSHDIHVAAVDSTSGFNLGGGLFYTYHLGWPVDGQKDTAHLGGVSLSFPIGDIVYLGGTAKYLRLTSEFDDPAQPDREVKGFSFDAGLTVRAGRVLSVGLVGYNLSDPGIQLQPLAFGGGLAVAPIPNLLIVADAVLEKVYGDPGRDQAVHVMGGAELGLGKAVAIRAGGGRDGLFERGYVSAGISAVSEVGALDFSFRQDVSGSVKDTFIGVSGRLFVPSP